MFNYVLQWFAYYVAWNVWKVAKMKWFLALQIWCLKQMLIVTSAKLNETRPLTSHWLDWFLNETNNCDLCSLKSTVWESSSAKNLILEFFFSCIEQRTWTISCIVSWVACASNWMLWSSLYVSLFTELFYGVLYCTNYTSLAV